MFTLKPSTVQCIPCLALCAQDGKLAVLVGTITDDKRLYEVARGKEEFGGLLVLACTFTS